MKIKIDLLIFDLDGTLMNSIPDLTAALNYTAEKFALNVFSESEVQIMVGGGIRKLIEDAFGQKRNTLNYQQYYNCFMDYYAQNHSNKSHLFEESLEVINHFRDKKLAILSNKFDHFTKQMAKDYNIDGFFDVILGATDNLKKKPSSEPVDYILEKTGVQKDFAMMIGDSEQDILTAKNSGIKSAAVTYGYRTKEQLLELNPDYICNNLKELTNIIE
ncbi:MAG: haloacid dehalogenase [Marinilabiliales bacterium]|nr:MAG: haloacid dehalogenase [Marinilabiliales bacterium]